MVHILMVLTHKVYGKHINLVDGKKHITYFIHIVLDTVAKKQEDYLRRLEGVCNSQDHQEWLESIDFNDIPIRTKKILLKKLLHSDLNDTLKTMSDIMSEEDGRKHNILLTIDGITSGTEIELENRTMWSNSNRGDYRFQMHDQVSFLSSLFGGEQKVIESKTKYDHHIVNHLKK